jgi:hypothetical protein
VAEANVTVATMNNLVITDAFLIEHNGYDAAPPGPHGTSPVHA